MLSFCAYTKHIDFPFFSGFIENQKLRELVCRPIVLIRNVSIFSFSLGFTKAQRLLELVLVPGEGVMSTIYCKLGEKRVIEEERVARSLYYYTKAYRQYSGFSGFQYSLYWARRRSFKRSEKPALSVYSYAKFSRRY